MSQLVDVMDQSAGHGTDVPDAEKGKYTLIEDGEDPKLGLYDKRLPCCGCGIGWCSLLIGFVFPPAWYYAAILYFARYYHKDPRERSGLAACAIAAIIFTIALLITVAAILL